MADAIVIKIQLTAGDLNAGKADIRKAVKSALDAAVPDAKEIGQKIGNALSAGIVEGLNKAKQLRTQLDQLLSPTQRLRTEESQERAHQQRLAEIRERGAQQQAAISARAAAQAERDARRFAESQAKAFQRSQPPDSILAFFKRYSSTLREAGESIQQAGFGLAALTGGIFELGRRAVASTIEIDKQVNTLRALTGSAEAAEKRYAALIAIAQKTPGLTTSLAATLDAQLRTSSVTEQTINRILPAIGKLNAVSTLGDPQKFAQNLVQLVTQNFERTDLKELVGQSPLAGEIIKNLFQVDSPTNAKAIRESAKKLGLTSTDAFFAAFAEAAAKNPKLANVTESLGTQFDKLKDRVLVALRPLGLAIIQALTPLVNAVVPIIERLSKAFADLPPAAKQAILVFSALVAAAGPLLVALGGIIQAFGAFGNILTVIAGTLGIGGSAGLGAALSGLLPVLAAVAGAVVAFVAAWQTNFAGIRDITADVINEAIGLFTELRDFWAKIAPDLKQIGQVALDALSAAFAGWSSVVGAVWSNTWDFLKTTIREALDVIKPAVESILALLTGDFDRFAQESRRLWLEAWDFIVMLPARAFSSLVKIVEDGLTSLLTQTGFARSIGAAIGDALGKGIVDGFIETASSKSTSIAIRAFLESVRGNNAQRDALRQSQRAGNASAGLGGEEITAGDLANNTAFLRTNIPKPPPGGGTASAESKARQLRQALLDQQKSFIEQTNRLQADANKRELEQFKQLYDDKKITISDYFDTKLGLTQADIGNEINALQQQIAAQEEALAKAKAGTPERIRLETELFKLRTDLTIKTRELTDAERENQTEALKALTTQRSELLKLTQSLALKVDESALPTAVIPGAIPPEVQRAREIQLVGQKAVIEFRVQDLQLQQQEVAIQNAITAGVLSEAEGKEATLALQRQYRDVLIQSLEIQKQAATDPEDIARIQVQIEQLRGLGAELTPLQALFKGFRSQAETLAESFERIGSAFKDKVLGVVNSGIDKLTSKLGFFKSLVGDILKSLTRVLLGNLFQPRVGGTAASGGLGGILGNLLNTGGGQGGGGLASIFTGGFAGGGGAGSILSASTNTGGILGALAGAINPISIPNSVSLGGQGSSAVSAAKAALGLGGAGGASKPGGLLGSLGLNFSGLFNGIGFGKAAGSGGALASALPLLGLSLGASVGTDKLTSIIGGAGGLALGVGLTAAPAALAGSSLGFLAPLFSNPITAIAGGIGLVGAFLLGRARQRRRDESTSGDYLQQAVDSIKDLRKQVESNEVTLTVSQAREIFNNQILQTFIGQINTIKTKSVRESRLKNQTADLRNLFEKEVIPAVQAQKTRQGINDKLIPEFALGGIVPGLPTPGIDSVLARLSPGEMVLTVRHQQMIQAMAGGNVFAAAGVPNAGQTQSDGSQAFAFGGIATAPVRSVTPTINLTVQLNVSPSEATNILEAAASTDDGQTILVRARKVAALNGIGRTRV